MWQTDVEVVQRGRTRRLSIRRRDKPVAVAEAIQLWRRDADFRAFFFGLLADAPFEAFFWEMPPFTSQSLDRVMEFVLVDAPALRRITPDGRAFVEHWRDAAPGQDVVTFKSLGGDAELIAPCPRTAGLAYRHLASFSRSAPEPQQHALWRAVGDALARSVGPRPLWVSTSGLGVAWLHVRLDTRPKYYTHDPYRLV